MPTESCTLASWKETSHYLGVNVRTAQKWERERGLPVRRVAEPRSRVGADTLTLDVWKDQITSSTKLSNRNYLWHLDTTVEITFLGNELGLTHIDLLRELGSIQ